MKDAGAVTGMTGLRELLLEIPYDCPEPDLSALASMEKLHLAHFKNCDFLKNMPGLTSLTMDNCGVSSGTDLSGLVNLRELVCTAFVGTARDYRFISGLPALEKLDMRGMMTYYDISSFFNMPTLRELNISGMECEINFDRLSDNPSLQSLKLDGIKLYKNVQVSGGGGIEYVDWDDVVLNEHTDFLRHYPGLKSLSAADNELTGIDFAEALPALETIDISDNYVTELKPLIGNGNLKKVICTGNPISNYRILSDGVMIVN